MVSHLKSPFLDPGTGSHLGHRSSPVANKLGFQSYSGHVGGISHPPAMGSRSTRTISELRLPSIQQHATADHVQGLRMCFQAEGISEEAIHLILVSWRQRTVSNSDASWRKWQSWCSATNKNPFPANLSQVLSFLAKQFEAGKQYWSLNCYCSAISSAHLPIDGLPILMASLWESTHLYAGS